MSSLPSAYVNVKSMYHIYTWLHKGLSLALLICSGFPQLMKETWYQSIEICQECSMSVRLSYQLLSTSVQCIDPAHLFKTPTHTVQYFSSYFLSHNWLWSVRMEVFLCKADMWTDRWHADQWMVTNTQSISSSRPVMVFRELPITPLFLNSIAFYSSLLKIFIYIPHSSSCWNLLKHCS